MTEKFVSKALEANLAETRYKDIVIPEDHQRFIDLSIAYYGLNKRAQECIIEYQHPFSNRKFVIEQLREIFLADFWFYNGLPDADDDYDTLLQLFSKLLSEKLKEDLQILSLRTLLEFSEKLSIQTEKHSATQHKVIKLLTNRVEAMPVATIKSSKFFLKYLDRTAGIPEFSDEVFALAGRVLIMNIEYWEGTTLIQEWYASKSHLFEQDYHNIIDSLGPGYFLSLKDCMAATTNWDELRANARVFDDIADKFAALTEEFDTFIAKFHYTFYLLHLPGMQYIQDRLIWNIDKILRSALDEIGPDHLIAFIDELFNLTKELRNTHMSSVLDCLLTLGKKVIDMDTTEDKSQVNYFEKKLIAFGFESPGIVYVNNDWQLHVNENHIKNIRVWLELIEYSQSVMEKLLSALIVNLRLGGIFISDTDLFQREITQILNSNIAPYFKKVKQLARIFPVYFNEIGAEGEIRNVTTSMDEISGRQDRLVHFLRKQVHTESNNTLIDLTRKVFNFWYSGDLSILRPSLPADVFESINLEDEWFSPVHSLVSELCKITGDEPDSILEYDGDAFDSLLLKLKDASERDLQRLSNLHHLYALLKEKYSFETVNIVSQLQQHHFLNPEEIARFDQSLEKKDYDKSLKMIYQFMDKLKKIIFNPQFSEGWENIYHKRHIAIGIPSMYGTYREDKFEALGLTFRIEKVATRLMEKLINQINLDYISAKTLNRIFEVLEYFRDGLELDGMYNQNFNSNLMMLKYSLTSRSFSLAQYINIFQFIADDIKKTIDKYFLKSYEYPLQVIIPQIFDPENALGEKEQKQLIVRKSEEFFRDVISSAFLVQPLDNLISRLLNSLRSMADRLPPELINDVMSYNSDLVISPMNKETIRMDNQIFLGSKAFFLKKLYLANFPVPPGFILTTEVFRRRKAIQNHPDIKKEMDELILSNLHKLEKLTGRQYGNPLNPLLLSVRSGTAISMPGAMDTFLNVGMNDEFVEELSKQPNFGWTSWDSYRRFIQSWGMAKGIPRDEFDRIITEYKTTYKVDLKMNFSPFHMRQIAMAYRELLQKRGVHFEQDLFQQLLLSINSVFDSWSSKRAKVYREHLHIADEWGTAVIVQKMILGNLNHNSGTGVIFTQNPNRERPGVHLYGDFTLCSQGEDIVGGLVNTLPVGETQRTQQQLKGQSLQTSLPDIYKRIYKIALDMTENHGFSPQEIEFTFESDNADDLYILQTRDQDIQKVNTIDVFNAPPDHMDLVGRGIGIGGGAMNGILAFDLDDLVHFRQHVPNTPLILVRPDTVPDDIGMIFECDGLLTAKGGATSHAAVTAVRLGKVCVVNCTDLIVNEAHKICTINSILFRPGDKIAIDGHWGNLYKGNYPIETTEFKAGI
jgi:pyruvate, orthophosphate dikinase